MDRRLELILKVFGAGLVKSGMLKPTQTVARGGAEVAEKGLQGLIGSRQAISAPRPKQLPSSVQNLLGRVDPSTLRPEFRDIVETAAARQAASLPATAAPGIKGLSPLITNRTPVAGPVPPPLQGPSPAQGFRAPLQGQQLDMFSGFNRLTYPKGAATAEGIKLGGTTFNPADVQSARQGTEFIQSLRTRGGAPFLSTAPVDEETLLRESLQQTFRPMASVADELYSQAIPRTTGLFSGPIEFGTYQARNLIRNNVGNLAELVRNNPRLSALAGLSAVSGAAGLGLYATAPQAPDLTAPETPVESAMGPASESVDAGGLINDPVAAQNRRINAAREIAANMGAGAPMPKPVYRGADGQTVITTRGEDEALTAAKQQYAKPQRELRDYYKQREAYAGFPAHKAEVISELTKRGVLDSPQLVAWAGANPELAYELLRKATGSNLLPSQQVPQETQKVITAPAGSNNANNMIGNTSATAEAAVAGTQGASDLKNFTEPQLSDEIRTLNPALIYALQGRNLI